MNRPVATQVPEQVKTWACIVDQAEILSLTTIQINASLEQVLKKYSLATITEVILLEEFIMFEQEIRLQLVRVCVLG